MNIEKNISLAKFTTFNIETSATYFAKINSLDELAYCLKYYYSSIYPKPFLILGGGSNLLFVRNFDGLVLKVNWKGIEIVEKNDDNLLIKVGAGEIWDEFVEYTVAKEWGGLENLSFIPGTVGASPIQNIGAYGAEVKDTIEMVEVFDLETQTFKIFTNEACNFGYRDSIFKQQTGKRYIICWVYFKLNRKPNISVNYSGIKEEIDKLDHKATLSDVRDCVITIRKSKLPDPMEIGNAGSFFKNPTVDLKFANSLKVLFPEMPFFLQNNDMVKLSAAWLIDKCAWKGCRRGNAGVHYKQALVLVNYGKATGSEILLLAQEIQSSVFAKFDVRLEIEVNII